MDQAILLRRKAFGLILCGGDATPYRLLTLTFPNADGLRFPGGNLEDNEDPVVGMFREIEEETGLAKHELTILRKLGTHNYYKPFIQANVQRHDYLLKLERPCPEQWVHTVTGAGGDAGAQFQIRLIAPEECSKISAELATFVTPVHIPEYLSAGCPP